MKIGDTTQTERLVRRRELIRLLMANLTEESREIEVELRRLENPNHVRLDQKFFDEVLKPFLANEPRGMQASEILRRLNASGFPIKNNQLRIFLTRYKQRGLLDFATMRTLDGRASIRWRLAN